MNKDKLNHVAPEQVARVALNFLDLLSDHDKEVQGAAIATTTLAYAKHHGIDVGDLFSVGNNILHSKHVNSPHIEAMQNYVRFET